MKESKNIMNEEIRQLREEFSKYFEYATLLIKACSEDYDKNAGELEALRRENEGIRSISKKFIDSITDIRKG